MGFIQRFGSSLSLNPHYHFLVVDGFYYLANGIWCFHFLPGPTQSDLESILRRIIKRYKVLVEKGILEDAELKEDAENPVDINLYKSQQGFIDHHGELLPVPNTAFKVKQDGHSLNIDGFSINAQVQVGRNQRDKLERLIRYVARGPIAVDRLKEQGDRLVYIMKKPWKNGADRVTFSVDGFLKRLIALIPPARSHTTRFHGAFAPNSKSRRDIVILPTKPTRPTKASGDGAEQNSEGIEKPLPSKQKLLWAEMIAMTFKADVTVCPKCQGRLSPRAVIQDPAVARAILKSVQETTIFDNRVHPMHGPPANSQSGTSNAEGVAGNLDTESGAFSLIHQQYYGLSEFNWQNQVDQDQRDYVGAEHDQKYCVDAQRNERAIGRLPTHDQNSKIDMNDQRPDDW